MGWKADGILPSEEKDGRTVDGGDILHIITNHRPFLVASAREGLGGRGGLLNLPVIILIMM